MRLIIKLIASGLLILGGGCVAIGAGLFAFVSFGYLEWDAALANVSALLLLSLIPTLIGLGMIFCGGTLKASDGFRTARRALAFWTGVIGACLCIAPLFNLIWIMIRGSAFTAPGAPITSYVGAILIGIFTMFGSARLIQTVR